MLDFIDQNGRGERIRTSGLYVPNVALYQAKLHPEVEPAIVAKAKVASVPGLTVLNRGS